ncbi:hypothetical protein [Marinobacter lipolyticus]
MCSPVLATACRCVFVIQILFVDISSAAPPGVSLADVYQQGMSLEGY